MALTPSMSAFGHSQAVRRAGTGAKAPSTVQGKRLLAGFRNAVAIVRNGVGSGPAAWHYENCLRSNDLRAAVQPAKGTN